MFGPDLSASSFDKSLTYTITGSMSGQNSEACETLTGNLTGKIALISRGSCFFLDKVYNAQVAGAAAVVIYNNVAGALLVRMAASSRLGLESSDITIPSYFISKASAELWQNNRAEVQLMQSGGFRVKI